MKNFFNQILEDGYDLLTLKKVPWPYELDDSKKVELLEKLLDYYSKKEDFDKCIILQKNIMMLSSTKKRRPRTKRKSN
jgi:hypothetical protein